MFWLFLFAFVASLTKPVHAGFGYEINNTIFPVCANVTYRSGNPDIPATLYDCVANIADANQPPSYVSGGGPISVQVSYAINNMISLNELESSVTLDFYWRLYWIDQRLNIPSLWDAVNNSDVSALIQDGAEIKDLIRNDDNPLNIWYVVTPC